MKKKQLKIEMFLKKNTKRRKKMNLGVYVQNVRKFAIYAVFYTDHRRHRHDCHCNELFCFVHYEISCEIKRQLKCSPPTI
jgi:hypothetical protein